MTREGFISSPQKVVHSLVSACIALGRPKCKMFTNQKTSRYISACQQNILIIQNENSMSIQRTDGLVLQWFLHFRALNTEL